MFLRPYSICHACGLKARLLLLLLFIHTFATACTDNATEEEAELPPVVRRSATDSDTTTVASANTFDLLGNPFVATLEQSNDLTSYFDRINADFTVDAEAIENRHNAGVTDTIYTIRSGESAMEFYAPSYSGELLLQMADIRSADIALRDNLRVGMPQAELLKRLRSQGADLKITQTPTEIIASAREGAPMSLHFFIQGGKVTRILYEGYVD